MEGSRHGRAIVGERLRGQPAVLMADYEGSEFGDPQGKRILIVDDDEGTRDLLSMSLGKEGFQVGTADDGFSALEAIKTSNPDLIILDLILPRHSGYEVMRHLQTGKSSRIPIIVTTGRFMDASTVAMLRTEANVREFIQKPIQPVALALTVHRILGTRPLDGASDVGDRPSGEG